jgi:hypothetical protein
MNRGQSHHNIFIKDKGRQTFLDLLGDMARLWKIEIYAYCLMDIHYHLLLSTPTGVLSRPMRHLDEIYTQKFNRVHHRDGPLFRGRYKAILGSGLMGRVWHCDKCVIARPGPKQPCFFKISR